MVRVASVDILNLAFAAVYRVGDIRAVLAVVRAVGPCPNTDTACLELKGYNLLCLAGTERLVASVGFYGIAAEILGVRNLGGFKAVCVNEEIAFAVLCAVGFRRENLFGVLGRFGSVGGGKIGFEVVYNRICIFRIACVDRVNAVGEVFLPMRIVGACYGITAVFAGNLNCKLSERIYYRDIVVCRKVGISLTEYRRRACNPQRRIFRNRR